MVSTGFDHFFFTKKIAYDKMQPEKDPSKFRLHHTNCIVPQYFCDFLSHIQHFVLTFSLFCIIIDFAAQNQNTEWSENHA